MKTWETHQQRKRKRAIDRLAEMEKELAENLITLAGHVNVMPLGPISVDYRTGCLCVQDGTSRAAAAEA